MNTRLLVCGAVAALVSSGTVAAASLGLGAYTFDTALFGDTLVESDGGTFRNANWLNIANANPGNPGALTGANFNTGIANIGLGGSPLYTIGYSTSIVNGAGADFAVITARYSSSDSISLTIDGQTVAYGPQLANATGELRTFFYGGSGPFGSELYVTPIDLSDFGLALGALVNSIGVTGTPELDLIRVAGFGTTTVIPVPGAMLLLGSGLLGLAGFASRRRS